MFSWGECDTVRGGYSYPLVGCTGEDVETMREPVGESRNVWFAGEHTHRGAGMTIHAGMEEVRSK